MHEPHESIGSLGLKQCSGCHALLGWPEVEKHMGGFCLPSPLFPDMLNTFLYKKSRSVVKNRGKFFCQQKDCAGHEQKAQPC